MTPRIRSLRGPLCALLLLSPATLAAQAPNADASRAAPAGATARAAAGPRYDAGWLRTLLLGESYRPLWTAPVTVPVLNPDTFAGGLAVERAGGGLSTEALRMKGRDGREYVFRSVDKVITPAMPPDLRGTLVHSVVQDLVSAEHPAAGLIAPPLLDAVGVLHVTPRLFVMPDHRFLGEHRERFAGRLGMMEVRPTDGFAGSREVESTEDLRERMEAGPADRVDAQSFLRARLMDVYLGDWDRGVNQWRWARWDGRGGGLWQPIPRDRDNAFYDSQGLLPSLARAVVPTLTRFGPRIEDPFRYHHHAIELDRLLLAPLPREAWDSTAMYLRTRLTDAAIESAVRGMPPEYFARTGDEMAFALRERREGLPAAAGRFYRMLSREVDVHATDQAERADVERLDDGSVAVTVHAAGDAPGRPFFQRRFVPGETREVRLYLHGGDDRAVVHGAAGGIRVRVIGGGGDDDLRDQSADGRRTLFYDDRGRNRIDPGGAGVDTRAWERPKPSSLLGTPPRDWGRESSLLAPYAGWTLNVGPVVGVGPEWTRYGFRRAPYASRLGMRVLWAPLEMGVGAMLRYDRRFTNRPGAFRVELRGSDFENVRFHGLGNDTPEGPDFNEFMVDQTQVRLRTAYELRPTRRLRLFAGPAAAWTDPGELRAATAPVLGDEAFWQAGATAGAEYDARDDEIDPRSGGRLSLAGAGYGTDLGGPFGRFDGSAAGYLSIPGKVGPTLALRVGGQVAVGDFPFQESAVAGGPSTLRGYPFERFRGDASLYGSAELRARIAYVNLGIARVHLGAFGLADVGRVYLDGDSEGDWHAGYGGGVSMRTLGRMFSVAYAHGERGLVYVTMGMPF